MDNITCMMDNRSIISRCFDLPLRQARLSSLAGHNTSILHATATFLTVDC